MLKSVYDTNNNGKVDSADSADSVPWAGVSGKPSTFAPALHQHSGADITSGMVATARLPAASTGAAGIAQLNSATNSTSTTQAATPSAVKAAYDLAAGKLSPGVTWGQLRGDV
jgi:phage-related tail fiber protein